DWMAANWPGPEAKAGSRRTATRVTPGAMSLSSSSHLPLRPYSNARNPVALPPGCGRLSTKPAPTGSGAITKTMGTGGLQDGRRSRVATGQDDIRRERDQFHRVFAQTVGIAGRPAGLDLHIAPDGPAGLLQALQKCPLARLRQRVVRRQGIEHADPPHPLRLRVL